MTADGSCVPSTRDEPSWSRATACLSARWCLCDSACSGRPRPWWRRSAERPAWPPGDSGRTWTPSSIRIRPLVADARRPRGLVDTSVLIDLERLDPVQLPLELAISAITMAELAAGPHATADPMERARRQDRLQRAEATFEPLPVDAAVARAFGRVYATIHSAGRKARGRRAFDLLIAATAI